MNNNNYKRDIKQYQKILHEYKKSWGGDKRWNNNMLQINPDIFIS